MPALRGAKATAPGHPLGARPGRACLGGLGAPQVGPRSPPAVGVCSHELGHQAGPVAWAWLALAWFAMVPLVAVALGRMMRNADEEEVARADTRPTPFEVGLPVPLFSVVHRRDVGRS